ADRAGGNRRGQPGVARRFLGRIDPRPPDVLVKAPQDGRERLVPLRQVLLEIGRQEEFPVLVALEVPPQDDALAGVPAKVDVVAATYTRPQKTWPPPGLGGRQAVDGHLHRRRVSPGRTVTPPIATHHPTVAPHRQVHTTAGSLEVLNDLAAGGCGSHDQDRAGRELGRVRISLDVTWTTSGGSDAAKGGTTGSWKGPVATTTFTAWGGASSPSTTSRSVPGFARSAVTRTPQRSGAWMVDA